ncbi:polysaccharide biosynthesis protein [Caldibacillus lycopersici]|uniref:Polysaccharide biosynthesis protein n=1 Tax=Perspicuibacillus lycopersici TaxID=1325689 RepID=A0AAE3LP32_9BACI|nr:polysaccharide biosynthesis protein [Perspicuibacillus lycopersici]MCU9614502.1 polysaccharide biosynthesis protein [Perspicuibacillus lycopersici]
MSSFLKGTIILAGAAFFGECIEFLINLVLAKELGEYGIGQYMSIAPVIGLVMIIASLELPISISKFVAERDKKYHLSMLKSAMKLALIFMVVLLAVAALIFTMIPFFSDVHPLIRWMILILVPIISISSIARGYFMGVQKMGKIAIANLFRRGMQLFLLVFIYQMFDFQIEVAILVAICSFIGGEVLVFIYLISAYFLQLKQLKNYPYSEKMPTRHIMKNLMEVALPTTGMRIFHSVTNAIEPFLIKQALVISGFSLEAATEHFGMIAGVAVTIGFFPAFMAHSLMTALIPAVSQSYAVKDQGRLITLLKQVIRLTLLYGIPVCIAITFFAEPLSKLFVESLSAPYYLKLLWPYFLLHYFTIPLQAFLIGMGLVKDALLHNVWATIVAFCIMFLLGSNHEFQMDGIIIGMNAGACVLMLLHYFTVCKKIGISLSMHRKEPLID